MRNKELLSSLSNCINHCNYCADACLEEENVKKMINCIRTDRICASICTATAEILATTYPAEALVQYCMEWCELCGEECARHGHDHCQECAQACMECVRACEQYLA
ncbi:four-helix bundle copper-binding protein [Sinomicrobium soli]|uniref:four-helix bundle copper-binding protein n=1 Tax=Sinomicrobium sp. N-1-3-6 TaxID=2219864 RepID=UPI000DCD4CB5|nr:four-helix bundle copper-binding protein [Sinomicrobium sp. N-1-3-6]RAV28634.1 four-helix bundle copper-binding protein [Sinomicrobium sp. N-1-3-6]